MSSSEQATAPAPKKQSESPRPASSKHGSQWGWPHLTSKPSVARSLSSVKDNQSRQSQDSAEPVKGKPAERRSSAPKSTQENPSGATATARKADAETSTIGGSDTFEETSSKFDDSIDGGEKTPVAEPNGPQKVDRQDAQDNAEGESSDDPKRGEESGSMVDAEDKTEAEGKAKTGHTTEATEEAEAEEKAVAKDKDETEAKVPSSKSIKEDTSDSPQGDETASEPTVASPEDRAPEAPSATSSARKGSATPSAASSGGQPSEARTVASERKASDTSTVTPGRRASKTPSTTSKRRASRAVSMFSGRKSSKASSVASGKKALGTPSSPSQGHPRINIIRASEDQGAKGQAQVDAKDFEREPAQPSADADMSPPALAGASRSIPGGLVATPKTPNVPAQDLAARLDPSKAAAIAAESVNNIAKLPETLADATGARKKVPLRRRIRPKVLRTPVLSGILGRPLGEQVSPVLKLVGVGMSSASIALNVAGNTAAGVTGGADPGKDGRSS